MERGSLRYGIAVRDRGSLFLKICTGSGGAIGSCHIEKSEENGVWHQIWYGTRIQWSAHSEGDLRIQADKFTKKVYQEAKKPPPASHLPPKRMLKTMA
ncbi:hypothetical protein Tco_1349161 [Tanacetum coccineum]